MFEQEGVSPWWGVLGNDKSHGGIHQTKHSEVTGVLIGGQSGSVSNTEGRGGRGGVSPPLCNPDSQMSPCGGKIHSGPSRSLQPLPRTLCQGLRSLKAPEWSQKDWEAAWTGAL